jgi:oligopeptide transport system ATP-binding protein
VPVTESEGNEKNFRIHSAVTVRPIPNSEGSRSIMNTSTLPIVQIIDIYKHYDLKTVTFLGRTTEKVKAVRGVCLDVLPGETLGLVGESGCGKSTLSKLIVKLEKPLSGTIRFEGKDIYDTNQFSEKELRKNIQLIFQNPFSTLSPQMTIGEHISDALFINGFASTKAALRQKVNELLDLVGLSRMIYDSYPENLSGGATQRVNIARAMAVQPKLLISDEGISILDVLEQARTLNLLRDLQDRFHLTYVIVTHDLSVVRHICDRIAVMYLGKIAEMGPNPAMFETTHHPYTRALINSIPTVQGGLSGHRITPLKGEVPSPIELPSGCAFHPRCSLATQICEDEEPVLQFVESNHQTACHHWKEVR